MKRLSLLLFILSPVLALSQNKLLTLEEAIATALQNNYDIQLSKNDSAVAALNYSYRTALFLPRLNGIFNSGWTNTDQKQAFADGTQKQLKDIKSNNYNAAIQLNWTLFDGLKMFATRDKAEQLIKLGTLEIKQQVINTVANVIITYYNVVRLKQELKAIEEQISINEERVKLSQYKLDIGVGIKPDVLQSKIDLNAQKAAKLEVETRIVQLKDLLNQAMNLPPEAKAYSYIVADTIPLNKGLTIDDIQNNITTTNPALLITQKNIDIAHLTLKERKADRFPVLSFNSAYSYNRNNNKATVNPFLPLYSRTTGRNLGFSAAIPILNGFNVSRQIKQASLDIQYQQLYFTSQLSQLNVAVIIAFRAYEHQIKALLLEEENILLARENLGILLETYKLGAATLLQLKEAQNSLEDAYDRLIAARYNTKLAETELLRLKGDLVK